MSEVAVFATAEVGRVFLRCHGCSRLMPHYRAYGSPKEKGIGKCKCGSTLFRPATIPTWQAALWLFVAGWFWRKTIRQREDWDPRMPMRQL